MRALFVIALLLPTALLAQNFGGLNQEDMQKMMQQAKAAQECMAKIDQSQLSELQVRSEELATEVRELCKSGDEEQARSKAVEYAKELEADPTVQQLKECSGLIDQQIPAMAWAELANPSSTNTDVCELAK